MDKHKVQIDLIHASLDFPVDSEASVRGDFVNLKDLLAQPSKMLIEVVFACVFIRVCVINVCVVLYNRKKKRN